MCESDSREAGRRWREAPRTNASHSLGDEGLRDAAKTSNRRAAIVVLAVKVKPPSAVARKSARTLTEPCADDCWPPCRRRRSEAEELRSNLTAARDVAPRGRQGQSRNPPHLPNPAETANFEPTTTSSGAPDEGG